MQLKIIKKTQQNIKKTRKDKNASKNNKRCYIYIYLWFQQTPLGIKTGKEKRKFKRDRRRWVNADQDENEALDKNEFKDFLFPKLSIIWVPEAHEDLDQDYDGLVSEIEFLDIHQENTKAQLI